MHQCQPMIKVMTEITQAQKSRPKSSSKAEFESFFGQSLSGSGRDYKTLVLLVRIQYWPRQANSNTLIKHISLCANISIRYSLSQNNVDYTVNNFVGLSTFIDSPSSKTANLHGPLLTYIKCADHIPEMHHMPTSVIFFSNIAG